MRVAECILRTCHFFTRKNHWIGARALVKLIKPKKESPRERAKPPADSAPWQMESPDLTSPCGSQPQRAQLDPTESPVSPNYAEEHNPHNGAVGKGRHGGSPVEQGGLHAGALVTRAS